MVELIICEKPSQANKIALALATQGSTKLSNGKAPYYKIKRDNKEIIVASGVGHLFTLTSKNKNSFEYPLYDVEWAPTCEVNKGADYAKPYLKLFQSLKKEVDEFTIATDYDVEGEVIGYNILKHIFNTDIAQRMKFSTLTKPDVVKAYENKLKTIDYGQAYAGMTRHVLDWYYGINFSRALTLAMKNATNSFKLLSMGRVQGPSLKIIVDREKEILDFKPETYYEVEIEATKDQTNYNFQIVDKRDKEKKKTKKKKNDSESTEEDFVETSKSNLIVFKYKDKLDEKQSQEILDKVKDKKTIKVSEVNKKDSKVNPPFPFNLTDFQTESHRLFRYDPKKTLDIAEKLYLGGFISYPRTSSQKLPKTLGLKNIIQKISELQNYKKFANYLLENNRINPNEGPKDDEAHPAIYPTGNIPNSLSKEEQNLFDLVVKRFLACFYEAATRESQAIIGIVNDVSFQANASRIKEKKWLEVYPISFTDMTLYEVKENEILNIENLFGYIKETQPPSRYTSASLLKELEKRNLGTKATRADIIETLFKREYVEGKSLTATKLGIKLTETMEIYCEEIVKEDLTRHFEEEMEDIRKDKKTSQDVIDEAKIVLDKMFKSFKEKEEEIGKSLESANRKHVEQKNNFGECPKCKAPFELKKGPYGFFVACNSCGLKVSLPKAKVFKYVKACEKCGYPIVKITNGKNKNEVCINKDCSGKNQGVDLDNIEKEKKICPKCGKELILRKGIYGAFYGCSGYPKCKHIEPLKKNNS
ncbi:MAG: DNA topoisomerase [Candidatus Nanoarchaeia archaeon]|nr:DNA topoisomerase [Candidatus Nanoarchaeia archaeon]